MSVDQRIAKFSQHAREYATQQNELYGVNFTAEYDRKFAQLIAADIAEMCADMDGGENMFSRAIRFEYNVE